MPLKTGSPESPEGAAVGVRGAGSICSGAEADLAWGLCYPPDTEAVGPWQGRDFQELQLWLRFCLIF